LGGIEEREKQSCGCWGKKSRSQNGRTAGGFFNLEKEGKGSIVYAWRVAIAKYYRQTGRFVAGVSRLREDQRDRATKK